MEFRTLIGRRLFGCDICQEVCPFNEGRASRQKIQVIELRPENGVGGNPELREILTLKSDGEFVARFSGTPLMRAGRRGLVRNACVVAGNIGTQNLIQYLEALIKRETDAMLQEHARWAIAEIEKRAKSAPAELADG